MYQFYVFFFVHLLGCADCFLFIDYYVSITYFRKGKNKHVYLKNKNKLPLVTLQGWFTADAVQCIFILLKKHMDSV